MKSKREGLKKRVIEILDDNVDLFEVRFLNQSGSGVEWLEDIKNVLVRFVSSSSALSEKEVLSNLVEQEKLSLLVRQELLDFGLDEDTATMIIRLLRGVLAGLSCDHVRKGGTCPDLVKWLYGSLQASRAFASIACVEISEAEFRKMQERAAAGTERLLSTVNAGAPNR